MKTAAFTVRADMRQAVRWKLAAEAEGFQAVGAWLAGAADAYLKIRARAGVPVPLAWHRGTFSVTLKTGERQTVRGRISPPFGLFAGNAEEPAAYHGRRSFCLVSLAEGRILATVSTSRQCKALASELARLWYRGGGAEPSGNPAPVLNNPA